MSDTHLFEIEDSWDDDLKFFVTSTGRMMRQGRFTCYGFCDDPEREPLCRVLKMSRLFRGIDSSEIRHFYIHGETLRLIKGPLGRWWEPITTRIEPSEGLS